MKYHLTFWILFLFLTAFAQKSPVFTNERLQNHITLKVRTMPRIDNRQATLDSLQRIIHLEKGDTNQINALLTWADYNLLNTEYLFDLVNIDSSVKYINKAFLLSQKLNYSKGEAFYYYLLASSLVKKGNYSQIIALCLKSLRIYESLNDKDGIIAVILFLQGIYRQVGDYENALAYEYKGKNLCEPTDMKAVLYFKGFWITPIIYMTLAHTYLRMNQLDSASFYTSKALDREMFYYNGNSTFPIQLLGMIQEKQGQYKLALDNYRSAISIAIQDKYAKDTADIYNRIGGLYMKTHQLDSAIYYAKRIITTWNNTWPLTILLTANATVAEAYKLKGVADSSLKYLENRDILKDSLFSQQKQKEIQNATFNEELTQKEFIAAQKGYEKKVQAYFLMAGLVVLFLIAVLLYRNNQHRKKAYILLDKQKQETDHQKTKVEQTLAELKVTQTQLIEKERIASLAAARLQELDAIKTRLYTNITHEFRTPLTVILGMAQQVLDKPKEYLQDGLKMIIRNGQNLLNLVNQMLDLSKLESGHLSLHYQQGDVVNFMKYIVESLHSLAESKGLQIHFISDLEQLTMDYDETRLQQVASNLLSNAVKFTPNGGNIYVSLSIQSDTFSFKVKDTGKGIAEADLPYIFDRFYQVDDTATRHGEGTGIGLSLTRELVKLMHGTISVKSQVNKGTEFEVVLPIRHIADLKKESELPPLSIPTVILEENEVFNEIQAVSSEKPLVLIADDNADVRAYIASCLSTDYNLLIAKDGQECEDLAFDKTPDLIISDVMMPFKDGFEVCQTLKTDERTSHIPIIMLTAKADMDSKLQGLEHGADVYLMKPFNKDELLLRIKKLLELRLQLQEYYRSTISGVGFGTSVAGSKPKTEIPNPKSNDNAFVIKVRTLIEANLANADFDVEKLCRDLLLSPSQVHRKLTALTGLSTNSFMRYVRLVKAKEQLIENAHFSIAAIAYDCGFNDPAYFSRAFKQEFGVTPQLWREQNVA